MKKILLILSMLAMCLTGCSKKVGPTDNIVVGWDNGTITFGGEVSDVSEYYGSTAKALVGGNEYNFALDNAADVTTITLNAQGIQEENMNKFKEWFYYSEYLGSMATYAKSLGDDYWMTCQVVTNGMDATAIAANVDKQGKVLQLTSGVVNCDFGPFVFGNEFETVSVRKDCALIPGLVKVSNVPKGCTEAYTFVQDNKEYAATKMSTGKYDYYDYEGYCIQIVAGMDVQQYIKFK